MSLVIGSSGSLLMCLVVVGALFTTEPMPVLWVLVKTLVHSHAEVAVFVNVDLNSLF